jgi:protein-S-isoprenylcysteine O-methyltransferase Ste14
MNGSEVRAGSNPTSQVLQFRMISRLMLTRLLILATVPLFLFTHHLHPEGHLVDTALGAGALILLLVAAGGRIWAALYIAGRKDQELVTQGPYSLVRNPLYLFSFLGFLGVGMAFGSMALAAFMAVIFALGHWPEVRREETRLAALFGEPYEAYRRRVPAFLPRLRIPTTPRSLPVNTRRFSRSLREAALIPLVFVVAEVLEWAKLAELLPVVALLP